MSIKNFQLVVLKTTAKVDKFKNMSNSPIFGIF